MTALAVLFSIIGLLIPSSWKVRRGQNRSLNIPTTNDLMNMYGAHNFLQTVAAPTRENRYYDEFSSDSSDTDDGEIEEEEDDQPPDFDTADPGFVFNLFSRFTWENTDCYTDRISFSGDIMKYIDRCTSIENKIDWELKTSWVSNRVYLGDLGTIIRKIKYKPILVELRIDNTAMELDIIRANFFCYTYQELLYILEFCHANKEKNFIISNYEVSEYASVEGPANGHNITTEYFCGNVNCRTIYNVNNNVTNHLNTRFYTGVSRVNVLVDLLTTLRNFKKCTVCERRLQLWTGEKDVERILAVLGRGMCLIEIAEQLFDFLPV